MNSSQSIDLSLRTVLVLGGVSEAVDLTNRLESLFSGQLNLIYSLLGITESPRLPDNAIIRRGGFGGVDGLTSYLREIPITAVINATHPFAQRMSRNAFDACHNVSVPLLRIVREEWQAEENDHWIVVGDLQAAIRLIPTMGQRIMVALGATTDRLAPLSGLDRTHFIVRSRQILHQALPLNNFSLIVDNTADVDTEIGYIRQHQPEALVCRNSGSATTAAKLLAARATGLPVILLKPPPSYGRDVASSADEVIDWVMRNLPRLTQQDAKTRDR